MCKTMAHIADSVKFATELTSRRFVFAALRKRLAMGNYTHRFVGNKVGDRHGRGLDERRRDKCDISGNADLVQSYWLSTDYVVLSSARSL